MTRPETEESAADAEFRREARAFLDANATRRDTSVAVASSLGSTDNRK